MDKISIDTLCVSLDYMENEVEVVFALFIGDKIAKSFVRCFSYEKIDGVVVSAVISLLKEVRARLITIRKTGNTTDDLIVLALQDHGSVIHFQCSSVEIIRTIKLHKRSVEVYDDRPKELPGMLQFNNVPNIKLNGNWIENDQKVICISAVDRVAGQNHNKCYDVVFAQWTDGGLVSVDVRRASVVDGCIMHEVSKMRNDFPDIIILDESLDNVENIVRGLEIMTKHFILQSSNYEKFCLVYTLQPDCEIVFYTHMFLV